MAYTCRIGIKNECDGCGACEWPAFGRREPLPFDDDDYNPFYSEDSYDPFYDEEEHLIDERI